MKQKISFKLSLLEIILVFIQVFFAGILCASYVSENYTLCGLLLLSTGIIVVRKKIRLI